MAFVFLCFSFLLAFFVACFLLLNRRKSLRSKVRGRNRLHVRRLLVSSLLAFFLSCVRAFVLAFSLENEGTCVLQSPHVCLLVCLLVCLFACFLFSFLLRCPVRVRQHLYSKGARRTLKPLQRHFQGVRRRWRRGGFAVTVAVRIFQQPLRHTLNGFGCSSLCDHGEPALACLHACMHAWFSSGHPPRASNRVQCCFY